MQQVQAQGHFAAHCRSKSVAEVADSQVHEEEFDDIAYLSTLGTQDANVWTCTIQVNNQDVSFKVDTGAEVTVISKDVSKALGLDALQPPTNWLYGPDQSPLEVVGETTVRLAYRDKQCTQAIFVLQKVKHNLLGLPTIRALHVLSQVDHVSQPITSTDRLQEYRTAQLADPVCADLIELCQKGWPQNKRQVPTRLQPYWPVRGELTLNDDLLLRGHRIVVPQSLQKETLQRIHSGHQGITKCSLRVTSAVWWPGVKWQLEDLIHKCPECSKTAQAPRQPLICTPLPQHPWEKVASDLFEMDGKTYLPVADYFSRCVKVQTLSTTTSASIIKALKAIFSRNGIPTTLVSENGPQYSSQEFANFSREYNFTHTTSSLRYPHSNGLAERMVRTVKSLLCKSSDPYSALLAYRSTPLPWCGYSPAELLMGRKIRSKIPQPSSTFIPE